MSAYIVDRDALCENIRRIRAAMDGTPVWAVVKGDGYGLGVGPFVEALLEQGIDRFAVTEPAEAEAVRQRSEQAQILMLRPISEPSELERLLELDVICTVSTAENAALLSQTAERMDRTARAHCKFDTGMGRYGFHAAELDQAAAAFALPALRIEGCYTHFHSAFCSESATRAQFETFRRICEELRQRGCEPGMLHCCNSSAALRFPELRLDAVRIGSAFLGRLNHPDQLGLQRIGWCETEVAELHRLRPGESTGYGAGWRARRETELAILPVGYFHGFGVEKGRDLFRLRDCVRGAVSLLLAAFRRKQITVRLGGTACPVRGHIGMLHTSVDVTGLDVRVGDPARLEINPLLQKNLPVQYRTAETEEA